MICSHERKNFTRFKYEIDGQTRYHKTCQCLICGQRVKSPSGGIWWPAENKEDIAKLPDFDLVLLDQKNKESESSRRNKITEDRQAMHEDYEKYLQGEDWKKRRKLVLVRCNGICEACLSAPATQVHHTNYDSIYAEVLWCLRGVCRECHEKIHGVEYANP